MNLISTTERKKKKKEKKKTNHDVKVDVLKDSLRVDGIKELLDIRDVDGRLVGGFAIDEDFTSRKSGLAFSDEGVEEGRLSCSRGTHERHTHTRLHVHTDRVEHFLVGIVVVGH